MTHRVTSKPLGWVTELAKAQIVMCYYKLTQSFCFSRYKYIPTYTIGEKASHVTSYAPESTEAFDCWWLTEGEGETDASGSSRYKQMRHSFILTCSLGARSSQRGFHTSAKISFISSPDSNLVCLSKALHKPNHVSYMRFTKYNTLRTLLYKNYMYTMLDILFFQGWKQTIAA